MCDPKDDPKTEPPKPIDDEPVQTNDSGNGPRPPDPDEDPDG